MNLSVEALKSFVNWAHRTHPFWTLPDDAELIGVVAEAETAIMVEEGWIVEQPDASLEPNYVPAEEGA